MLKRMVSGIMLTLLLIGMLTLAFNIQPVEASGTIYIRADGSIDPTTANITSADNVTYYFTDNNYDSIVVERNDTIVDGNGYTVQGTGAFRSKGIYLSGISNVTIKNTNIKDFDYGVYLTSSSGNIIIGNNITNNNEEGIRIHFPSYFSSNNSISGNTITNTRVGINVAGCSDNSISGNTITNLSYGLFVFFSDANIIFSNNVVAYEEGIVLGISSSNNISKNNIATSSGFGFVIQGSFNTILENNITNNEDGIHLVSGPPNSFNNTVSGNNIANNTNGVHLKWIGAPIYDNTFYHNNFKNNSQQVKISGTSYHNTWDDGYPSGGNYWSDYEEKYPDAVDENQGENQDIPGSDGIWDHPYVIDENNADRYPYVNEKGWKTQTPEQAIRDLIDIVESMNLQQGIDNSLDAKLTAVLHALEALNADQRNDAINKLNAFINEVEAQRERKLTNEQADYLIAATQEIIDVID